MFRDALLFLRGKEKTNAKAKTNEFGKMI